MLTYQTQAEKIIQAYLKEEVNPYDPCACFIGNLLNKENWWVMARNIIGDTQCIDVLIIPEVNEHIANVGQACIKRESNGLYSIEDICRLEENFLRVCAKGVSVNFIVSENALFEAMTSTLELLKQIHINKGEVIEEDENPLQKRVLKTA